MNRQNLWQFQADLNKQYSVRDSSRHRIGLLSVKRLIAAELLNGGATTAETDEVFNGRSVEGIVPWTIQIQ